MSVRFIAGITLLTAIGWVALGQDARKPFGGPEDVAFAQKLWKAMEGYRRWKLAGDLEPGKSPHGKLVQLFCTWVTVDGRAYPVVVKDNYGGRGVTAERVGQDRQKWLKAVTVMLQRQPGYDDENNNWFWVKYKPDGSIGRKGGVPLAGRVAKGEMEGCISCHATAGREDYLFSNDH